MIHALYHPDKLYSDLGAYLQRVSSDPALYASYFWWRQHYEVDNIDMGRHFVKVERGNKRLSHSMFLPRTSVRPVATCMRTMVLA